MIVINEQSQIAGPRVYVNSTIDSNYNLLRMLSIPNIAVAGKSQNNYEFEIEYYFKVFADYFGDSNHPIKVEKDTAIIESIEDETKKHEIRKAPE